MTPMICHLKSRRLLRIAGVDAAIFLQNTLTNDIRRITAETPLQYNLLLTPQGKILSEIFVVWQAENTYLLDVYAPRQSDLIRRLMMFLLRAKVTIEELPEQSSGVFARFGEAANAEPGWLQDPRRSGLGTRRYISDAILPTADDEYHYNDFCISQGVATAEAIRHEQDFVHDVGFEKLNAIAWDKGCFIGQEVAARVEHRGLAKKGLYHVTADAALDATAPLADAAGTSFGEVRQLSHDAKSGLALIKNIVFQEDIHLLNAGVPVIIHSAVHLKTKF